MDDGCNRPAISLVPALLLALVLLLTPGAVQIAHAQISSQIAVAGTAARAMVSANAGREILLLVLRGDGEPELVVQVEQHGEPLETGRGRHAVSFLVDVGNRGTEPVDELEVRFKAAAIYGADGFGFIDARLLQAPGGFGASVNPYFDGAARTNLLTSGGRLAPGQRLVLRADLLVNTDRLSRAVAMEVGGIAGNADMPVVRASLTEAVNRGESAGETCSRLSGWVFLDSNRDGLRQAQEAGISGVRVMVVDGEESVTGRAGEFSVTCPQEKRGKGFVLMLDSATLPKGLGLTGKETLRITPPFAKDRTADFAVSAIPVVTLSLSDRDFAADTLRLNGNGLTKLRAASMALQAQRARLVIILEGEANDEATQRGDFARALMHALWLEQGEPYPLAVTVRAAASGG